MRRLFWMGVGAAAAVVAAQQVRSAWHRYTPQGVAEQVEQAGQGAVAATRSAARTFVEAFRDRERDLTEGLLVTVEDGDPSAVFRRSRPTASGPAGTRPSGRVDPDEPLYDF